MSGDELEIKLQPLSSSSSECENNINNDDDVEMLEDNRVNGSYISSLQEPSF